MFLFRFKPKESAETKYLYQRTIRAGMAGHNQRVVSNEW